MGLETFSTKRNRVYPRRFDHEEAIRMYQEEGFLLAEIARHMGVTPTAIKRVVDLKFKEQFDGRVKRWLMSQPCVRCGAPRSRTAKYDPSRRKKDSGLCQKCWWRSRQTRFRVDENDNPIEVRCSRCQQWKPAATFPKSKNGTRGFHGQCTQCSTKNRRKYRKKLPCVICGAPALHPKEKGPTGAPFPRCRSCFEKHLEPRSIVPEITEDELERSARRDVRWAQAPVR